MASWKDIEIDGEKSFVAAIQLFSNMPQSSLKADPLSIYPIYNMALNCFKKSLREQMIENRTIVFRLPFSFDSTNADDGFPNLNFFHKNYGRAGLLQSLHDIVECAVERLLSLPFWDSRSLRPMGTESCTQYSTNIHCRYSQGWGYVLPKKGMYDQTSQLLMSSDKKYFHRQKDVKGKGWPVQWGSVIAGVWNLSERIASFVLEFSSQVCSCQLPFLNNSIFYCYLQRFPLWAYA